MTDRIRDPIPLNEAQVKALRGATGNGTNHFPDGYALVHDWIKDHPSARADGTAFWFEQARGINNDDSLSARFIRRHTENGLDLDNVPMSVRKPMQELSNMIAKRVTQDLLDHHEVPPLAQILNSDIRVALDDGYVPLGGWGGSFYYYDMPFIPDKKDLPQRPGLWLEPGGPFPRKPDGSYHTIGDEIDARGERELLLRASSRTIKDMVVAGEIRLSDAPELLQTSWNAGMPAAMKAEVTLRASVMVAEHVRDHVDRTLQQIPEDLQHILEQQRRNLLDGSKQKLDDLLHPLLPGIPRVSAQEQAPSWQQLAGQLDSALGKDRALAQRHNGFDTPPEQQSRHEGLARGEDGPFNDPHVNRAYAALLAGDSQELDRVAIAFSQSPEGQRMAHMGDQLLARQQMLEQQLLLEQQQAQARDAPVMRM